MIEKLVHRHHGGVFYTYNGTIYRRLESVERRILPSFPGREVRLNVVDAHEAFSSYVANLLDSGRKHCVDEPAGR